MAYTNKYNLPDESRTREILIRRHASIRRTVRAGSFRDPVGYFVLQDLKIKISSCLQLHSSSSFSLNETSQGLKSTTPSNPEGIWRPPLPSGDEVMVGLVRLQQDFFARSPLF